MADEQKMIYLSHDEDLTMVRERLQRTQSRRIVLVVPAQTQLRSHMSWKLIHGWARELGKDVFVVSGDRAIRTVVKAAGFQVADSLEAAPPSKGRFGSRGGRTNTGASSDSSRPRTPPARGPEPATGAGRSSAPPRQSATFTPKPENYADERFQVDDLGPGEALSSRPPIFEAPAPQFGPDYNFSVGSASPVQPVAPPSEDDDDELLPSGSFPPQDYERARSFFQAAQEDAPASPAPGAMPAQPADASLSHLEDDEAGSLPEQRASVSPSSWHQGGADVTDLPTDVFVEPQVEDLGDKDDFLAPPAPPYAAWANSTPDQDATEQGMAGSPRVQGIRPRASRGGPRPPASPFDVPEEPRPAIADMPTTELPGSARPRSTGKMPAAGASRAPEPLALPQPGQAAPRSPSRARYGAATDRTRTPSKVPARRQAAAGQRPGRRSGLWPIFAVIAIILVIVALLGYFVPSAAVTVTLPALAYHEQMGYTASAGIPLNIITHTLPAETLTFPITVQGTGQATGSKPVGTVAATGAVTFTNKGSSSIEIPTGTTVTTPTGVAFVTTADALVLGNDTNVDPVQASQPGATGNVSAGSIIVIPQSTFTQLQQANPGVSISLAVTNANATTGGRIRDETTITAGDVSAAAGKLTRQVNAQVATYVSKHTSSGDVAGTPVLSQTPVPAPAVGSVVSSGAFTVILHVQASVLVARSAEIQSAASQQINATLKRDKPGYELVPQQPVQITFTKHSSSSSSKALSLNFEASGQIVRQISVAQIRSLVSGKSPGAARAALMSQHSGIPAIQNASIAVYPSFFGWVPFWQQRITVNFKTALTVPTPKRK